MNARPFRFAVLYCVVFAAVPAFRVRAEESPDGETDGEVKRLNEQIEKAVDWYGVYPDLDAKDGLKPLPVLRWRNAARGQEGEAMMVFWSWHGRPIAMASIYPWVGQLHHEFGSLSRSAKLVARDRDAIVWSPNAPGMEFKDMPDSPPPAETAAARLRQMRSIAERFTATMTGWKGDNSDREELRMLPRPLYRYDLKDSQSVHTDLVDGAAYAYAMGTDPEVVLLLEAVTSGEETRWQYAFARATSGGLEVRLEGKAVWAAEKFPPNRGRAHPQLTLGRPLE
ncbi:MAG: hypothetical protein HY290_08610 [Planctomycetia bacterium]|nr:hypothetical protein [Planctomycetia bacterium]